MLDGLLTLASFGFGGGTLQDVLIQWEQLGFFSYLLPFLLIFAVIFGILNQIKIFQDNRAINGVIALVVGLMALQFDFVAVFFSEIFPRVGVGLGVILVILILVGIFLDPGEKGVIYTLLGISAIIVITVLYQTAGAIGWSAAFAWKESIGFIASIIVILVAIGIIVSGGKPKSERQPYWPLWPYGGAQTPKE